MTTNLQIKCINKADRFDPNRRITNVGGISNNGTRWKFSEDDAIKYIENGQYSFYVTAAGRTVQVIVAVHNGRKYLKTEADGIIPDNLLSLPECP